MLHEIIKMFNVRISFLCALMTLCMYSAFSFLDYYSLYLLFIHALDTGAFIYLFIFIEV